MDLGWAWLARLRLDLGLASLWLDFPRRSLGGPRISPGASTNLTWSFYESHLELP